MSMLEILFYAFVFVAAAAAFGILLIKNIFKAALLLLICLLSLAAVYIFLMAEYIAVVQLLIYSGGILVLIIFGIMLTSRFSGGPPIAENKNIFEGILAGLSVFTLLTYVTRTELNVITEKKSAPVASLQPIGEQLITTYAFPFELAGIVLLIALIGAAVTTSLSNSGKP